MSIKNPFSPLEFADLRLIKGGDLLAFMQPLSNSDRGTTDLQPPEVLLAAEYLWRLKKWLLQSNELGGIDQINFLCEQTYLLGLQHGSLADMKPLDFYSALLRLSGRPSLQQIDLDKFNPKA